MQLPAGVLIGILAITPVVGVAHAEVVRQGRCPDFTGTYSVYKREHAGKASGTAQIRCEGAPASCTLTDGSRTAQLRPVPHNISKWRVIPLTGGGDWPRWFSVQDASDCTTLLFGNGTLWRKVP